MTLGKMLHLSVPETSYSSSEGEDDFYDANDDPFSSQVTTPTRWVPFKTLLGFIEVCESFDFPPMQIADISHLAHLSIK